MSKNNFKINKKIYREINNPIIIDDLYPDNECSICLIQMEKSIVLHCSHRFHLKCITEWYESQLEMQKKPCCPFCRKNIDIQLLTNNIKQKQCCCIFW